MSGNQYLQRRPGSPRSSQAARPRVDAGLGNQAMVDVLDACEDVPVHEHFRADRPEAVLELRDLAIQLRDDGIDGVDIWAELMEAALDQGVVDEESPEAQLDRAMQDVAAVTVGRNDIQGKLELASGPGGAFIGPAGRQTLSELDELYGHLEPGVDPYFAGVGLDPTDGRSFRDDISDGTNNQIFHTGFFHYMAYAVDGTTIADAGNLAHETEVAAPHPVLRQSQMHRPDRADQGLADVVRILPDGGINWSGQTREDLQASLDGADLGQTLRDVRDSGHLETVLDDIPALIQAAYGHGTSTPGSNVAVMMERFDARRSDAPFDLGLAREMARARERRDGWQGPFAHRTSGEGDLDFAHVVITHYEAAADRGETDGLMERLERTLEESGMTEQMCAAVRRRLERRVGAQD